MLVYIPGVVIEGHEDQDCPEQHAQEDTETQKQDRRIQSGSPDTDRHSR